MHVIIKCSTVYHFYKYNAIIRVGRKEEKKKQKRTEKKRGKRKGKGIQVLYKYKYSTVYSEAATGLCYLVEKRRKGKYLKKKNLVAALY